MEPVIIRKLSSQSGDRTQAANQKVARKCISDPRLLSVIVSHMNSSDQRLVADCSEVMTIVAQEKPDLVIPFIPEILPLIHHTFTKIRWEITHTLFIAARIIPDIISQVLPDLLQIIQKDKSMIVRDYSISTICAYAGTSKHAAEDAYPCLLEALQIWGEKHAARVMEGLLAVSMHKPAYKNEIMYIAEGYTGSLRVTVRKAARKLFREIQR